MKDLAKIIKALALNSEFNFVKNAIVMDKITLNGQNKKLLWSATVLLPDFPFKHQVRLMIVSTYSNIFFLKMYSYKNQLTLKCTTPTPLLLNASPDVTTP